MLKTSLKVMLFCMLLVVGVVYASAPDTPLVVVTPGTVKTEWGNTPAAVNATIPAHSITVNSCTNGSLVVNKTKAQATDTVTITAVPASGYVLDYIEINGTRVDNTAQFEMPSANTIIQGYFMLDVICTDFVVTASNRAKVGYTGAVGEI